MKRARPDRSTAGQDDDPSIRSGSLDEVCRGRDLVRIGDRRGCFTRCIPWPAGIFGLDLRLENVQPDRERDRFLLACWGSGKCRPQIVAHRRGRFRVATATPLAASIELWSTYFGSVANPRFGVVVVVESPVKTSIGVPAFAADTKAVREFVKPAPRLTMAMPTLPDGIGEAGGHCDGAGLVTRGHIADASSLQVGGQPHRVVADEAEDSVCPLPSYLVRNRFVDSHN